MAAGLALSGLDAKNDQWKALAPVAAGWIAETSTLSLDRVVAGFEPAGSWLKRPGRVGPGARAAAWPRSLAALARFGSDDPELLVQVALKADKSELEALLPVLGQQAEVASKCCRDEIRNPAASLAGRSTAYEPRFATTGTQRPRGRSGGVLADRFAICPPLAWNRFEELAAELNKAGYRPTRVRPTYVDEALCVSAVWKPDHADWKVELSLTSEELLKRDVSMREQGYLPEDLAVHAEYEGNGALRGTRVCG